jgi:hypothetical protein
MINLYYSCGASLGFKVLGFRVQGSSVQYFQYKMKLHIMLFLMFREFLNISFN